MPNRINGASSSTEVLSSNMQFYVMYASSPSAFSDPDNATGVNIRVTGNYADETQKNFEVLLQSIGLRAMPVAMGNPKAVLDLGTEGAPSLTGEGFVWTFAAERAEVFTNFGPGGTLGSVGLLVDELHGIVLPSGTVLKTAGVGKNIEFIRNETL